MTEIKKILSEPNEKKGYETLSWQYMNTLSWQYMNLASNMRCELVRLRERIDERMAGDVMMREEMKPVGEKLTSLNHRIETLRWVSDEILLILKNYWEQLGRIRG